MKKTIIFNNGNVVAIEDSKKTVVVKTIDVDMGLRMQTEEQVVFLGKMFKKKMMEDSVAKWLNIDSKLYENDFEVKFREDVELEKLRAIDINGSEESFLSIFKKNAQVDFYVTREDNVIEVLDRDLLMGQINNSFLSESERAEVIELIWMTISMLSYEELPNISVTGFSELIFGLHTLNVRQKSFLKYITQNADQIVKRIVFKNTDFPEDLGSFQYHIFNPIEMKEISYSVAIDGVVVVEEQGHSNLFEAISSAIPNLRNIRVR